MSSTTEKATPSHTHDSTKNKLSWSLEAVASIPCSGHGRAYLDGSVFKQSGGPICECNTCYGGPDCSLFLTACAAKTDNGDPLFLEPFWKQHASSSAVVVLGWHRMSYTYPDHSYISQQLENHIRDLHSVANNAVARGKCIIDNAISFCGGAKVELAAMDAIRPMFC